MKKLTKEHSHNDYYILLGLCGAFSVVFIIKQEPFYLAGALIMLGLAVFRKQVLFAII